MDYIRNNTNNRAFKETFSLENVKGIIKALMENPNEERKSADMAVQMEATAGIKKEPEGGKYYR